MGRRQGEVFGVFRHPLYDVGAASGIGAVVWVLALIDLGDDRAQEGLRWVGWESSIVLAVGAWLVVRVLRRSIAVTSFGVELRSWLRTDVRSWAQISDVGASRTVAHGRVWVRAEGFRTLEYFVWPTTTERFLCAAETAGRQPVQAPVTVGTGLLSRRPYLLALPALTLVASAANLRGAIHDTEYYRERSTRLLATLAEPLSWEWHRIDDGEQEYHDETWTRVRFLGADETEVEVLMKRRGTWPDPGEPFLVVFDPVDPTDVDFVDHPAHDGQEDSARVRRNVSVAGFVVAAGLLALMLGLDAKSRGRRPS